MRLQSESETIAPRSSPAELRRIVVYGNPEKPRVLDSLRELAQWSARRNLQLCAPEDLVRALDTADGQSCLHPYHAENGKDFDFAVDEHTVLVCLGGDGTLVHAIHRFWPAQAPVLGVNLGSLGFNAAVEPQHMISILETWEQRRIALEERMLMVVRHERDGATLATSVAVNDVVLAKQDESRLIHIALYQGGDLVCDFGADGLILATPTGSTAYNLSAGGPIVYPTMKAIIATGICPHTLMARPVVLESQPPVRMRFSPRSPRDQVLLWVDGQQHWPIGAADWVIVEQAPQPLRMINRLDCRYFDKLREKLGWSGNSNE